MDNLFLLKKSGQAILVSVGGCVVLVLFFSTFMQLDALIKIVPLFIAFNAAMAGYSLVERTRQAITRKHLAAVAAGFLTGLASFAVLNVIYLVMMGGYVFDLVDLLIFAGIGVAFGEMGALLAIKYFRLKA